jgi:hypothetical protein
MTKQQKSYLTLLILLLLIFGVPYLWRRYRDNDIENNRKYAFAKIIKKSGSLKNGNSWHYEFTFQGKLFKGHWSTDKDYDVNIGDYFLVIFSSVNPDHNKIIYKYKLRVNNQIVKDSVWNTPPENYTKSGLKSDKTTLINGL